MIDAPINIVLMKSDLRDMATYTGAQIRARKYSALAGHRGDGGNMDNRTFHPPLDPMSMKSAAPVSGIGRLDSSQFALPNPNFPHESPRQMTQIGYTANQIGGSPALSDVSTIPWLSRMSSHSRQDGMSTDSRCQSSTSEVQEDKGTGHFLKDSAGQRKFSSEESHRVKGDFPLRPIPQLVPSDYIASLGRKGIYLDNSRPPSTATSLRSTVLDFGSRNSSSFSSPRHSARGRKRGLSISPLSADLIDLNAIIRTSPNSLVAFITASRGSSSASRASGSYGHLSAASNNISPSPAPPAHAQLGRQRHPFATPMLPRSAEVTGPKIKEEDDLSNTESVISSTLPADDSVTVADRKRLEEGGKVHFKEVEAMQMTGEVTPKAPDESDEEEEKEVVECRCRWKKCFKLFETQNELVQHVNGDHIQKNKKDYTCYWDDCSREQKPFKAMYMLVVHVRRHTGEKPHKCNFRDCTKAYSRLENLKTHLRSHTGERPYVCEFEGCNKAFSNASDRAKHQNRTHSSVKQYGCKIPGCPKRYTDPSSLRKHMKTVHGTLPQPNKKMKGDRSEPKEKHSGSDKNRSEAERRKSVGECLTVKPLQKNSEGHGKGTGASAAYSQAYHMSGGHHLSPGSGSEGFGNTYRAWGVQQASPTSTTNDSSSFEQWAGEGNPSCNEQGAEGSGPLIQLTPRPPVLPRISGKPRAYEGLLHEVSRRLSEDRGRRSSNASLLSVDSSYQSGNESGGPSHAGSRRGSDIGSVHSYLSSRRSSAASPLPSSRLSPGSIAKQTVLEGKVLEPSDSKAGLINYPIEGPTTTDPVLPEGMTSSMDFAHNPHNRHSRVSSGYGSQNNYFKCQSPAFQRVISPFPLPSGQRRASDGNVRRLSDQGFNPLLQRLGLQNRRGSEPVVPVREHIEVNDRRQSLNIYDPLPLPPSMHKFSLDENGAELIPCSASRSSGTNQPSISVAQSAQDRYLGPNLCVQHQNDFSDLQLPPSEEELASGSNFMPAMPAESLIQAADSTVPDPTEFANMGIPVVTSGSFRTPPGTYHNSSVVDFNASISWSGVPKDAGKHSEVMEADSTMDHTSVAASQPRSYEEIMVNDLRALSTNACADQNSIYGGGSNMAINDMNTLLNSLAVENRYYETSNYDNTHFI